MLQLLYRPAESDGKFMPFATAATLGEARDELASPVDLNPHHGDLARVVGGRTDGLCVFDAALSSFVVVPNLRGAKSWFEQWESDKANAWEMLRRCTAVDRRRLVLAACDCAERVLRRISTREVRPRAAIKTARMWAVGKATPVDVQMADAAASAATLNTIGATYYATTAASSAINAAAVTPTRVAADSAARAAFAAAHVATYTITAGVIDDARDAALRSMAPLVRRHIPLSVLACSLVGAADPLPIRFKG